MILNSSIKFTACLVKANIQPQSIIYDIDQKIFLHEILKGLS